MKSGNSARLAKAGALLLIIVLTVLAAALLLLVFSSDFGTALKLFFLGPFSNRFSLGNMLSSAVSLAVAGLGAAVAFGTRSFNLGGEGQVYFGAIASAFICLSFPNGGLPVAIAALLGAMLAGGLIGLISGELKYRLAVDELISSFLLSSALVCLGDFLVTGPLQDPASNFQTTAEIAAGLRFPKILLPSRLSAAFWLAIAVIAAAAFFIDRTRLGFELRLSGRSPIFSRYVGINTGGYACASMAASGAFYGLAGALMVMGAQFKVMKGFSSGLGWSGIAVALLAGSRPLALIPAALFFAYLGAGADAVMIGADVTSEIADIVQAVVFFLVTAKAVEELFLRLPALSPRKSGPAARQKKDEESAGSSDSARRPQ